MKTILTTLALLTIATLAYAGGSGTICTTTCHGPDNYCTTVCY